MGKEGSRSGAPPRRQRSRIQREVHQEGFEKCLGYLQAAEKCKEP